MEIPMSIIFGVMFFLIILIKYAVWASKEENEESDENEKPVNLKKRSGPLQMRRMRLHNCGQEIEDKRAELETVREEVEKTKKEIGITRDIAVAEIELQRMREKLEQLNRVREQTLLSIKKKRNESA